MVRALVLYRGDPGSIPSEGMGNFSAMLYFVMAIMSLESRSNVNTIVLTYDAYTKRLEVKFQEFSMFL